MRRLLPLLLACLLLSGCAPREARRQFFAMDTTMSVTIYGKNSDRAAAAAVAEVQRLDALLSRTRPDSDVNRLNAAGGAPTDLSPETVGLLRAAKALAQDLPGAFDPTIAPLMDAWDFSGPSPAVPAPAALEALLPLVDAGGLTVEDSSAALAGADMAVDLGGIAKGYAADRLTALLTEEYGVTSALLSLGSSSMAAVGARPDGAPWRIGVRDPLDTETYLGVLSLTGTALSTSGAYERYFEKDGVVYHHILDPKTGAPAQSDLLSVTVVSQNGAQADALSTALFILGAQAALDYWRDSDGLGLVLVRFDRTVLITEGLDFQGEKGDYIYEVVRR